MYKDRGEDVFHTGPVWDFDLAFENDDRTYPIMNLKDYIYRTKGSCAGKMKQFVDNIVVYDASAKAQLLEIWDEVRQGGLTEEYMTDCIDSWEQTLGLSQELNFIRWPIMNTKVHLNPRTWGSYEAEVQNVRRYMKERFVWMDNKLGYTYQRTGIKVVQDGERNMKGDDSIYNLNGQRMQRSELMPGLYIINGKKVVVK